MRYQTLRTGLIALALLPAMAFAQSCETLGKVGTDGTGAPDRYRQGGTFLFIEKQKITPDSELRVVMQQGPLKYVTVHTRVEGGIWYDDYKGPKTTFAGTDPVFQKCRAEKRCTHFVMSINGAHERYERGIVSSANIELCKPDQDNAHAQTALKTLTAPLSGWQVRMPEDWSSSLDDDPQGGSGMIVSPDEEIVVGITTVDYDASYTFADIFQRMRTSMFPNASMRSEREVRLAGLAGLEQRYDFTSEGQRYAVVANYLAREPNRMYIVWAIMPPANSAEDLEQAQSIMRTFSLLKSAAPEPVALSLGMLAAGSDPSVGQVAGAAQTRLASSAPQIHLAAGLLGTERQGTVTLALVNVGSGQQIARQQFSMSGFSENAPALLRARFVRPASGWVPGIYRVVVLDGTRELGSQMLVIGETP